MHDDFRYLFLKELKWENFLHVHFRRVKFTGKLKGKLCKDRLSRLWKQADPTTGEHVLSSLAAPVISSHLVLAHHWRSAVSSHCFGHTRASGRYTTLPTVKSLLRRKLGEIPMLGSCSHTHPHTSGTSTYADRIVLWPVVFLCSCEWRTPVLSLEIIVSPGHFPHADYLGETIYRNRWRLFEITRRLTSPLLRPMNLWNIQADRARISLAVKVCFLPWTSEPGTVFVSVLFLHFLCLPQLCVSVNSLIYHN